VALYRRADGLACYDTSTQVDGLGLGTLDGEAVLELAFERLELLPGEYDIDVGVYQADWEYAYDYHRRAYQLRVTGGGGDSGVYRPPHRWRVSR
jgi:lipopolysaccharide transport system ATP-binding protein